jgi:hypothetical protein
VFFYEGGIAENSMKGRGRIRLLQRNISYEGMFEDNQFHGNGVMTHGEPQVVITGMWERGLPKNIRFDRNAREYSIVVESREGEGVYQGVIRYWEGMRYEGQFMYDDEKKRFHVTGKGRLYYKNNDYISGQFVEGNVNGEGEFVSAAGRYKGEFRNGRFEGQGEFVYKDGKILSIGWRQNKPHGEGWLKINSFSTPVLYEHGTRVLNVDKSTIRV